MPWTTDVLTAAAEHLATAGVGAWRPEGAYAAGETGILLRAFPPSPDRVVVLTAYPVAESAHLSDVTLGIQVRCRGTKDPRDVADLADAVRDLWHGARGLMLGPAHVALLWRQSHTELGADGNGRWSTSSNFYAQTTHASQGTEG